MSSSRLTILILTIFLLTPTAVSAIPLPLGAKCKYSHECGVNMGCRQSERGDFKICKITVPGTEGCSVVSGENMCADKMICENNRCRHTYGAEDLKEGNFKIELEPPQNQPFRLPSFLSFITIREYANLSIGRKILNIILAVVFLISLTSIFKGYIFFKSAQGLIATERKGITYMWVGSWISALTILLWLLLS